MDEIGEIKYAASQVSSDGGCDERDLELAQAEFNSIVCSLATERAALISLFAVEVTGGKHFVLFYVFEQKGCVDFLVLKRHIGELQTASIASIFPSACWFEREVRDGFGIDFIDAYDKRPLFLHETYPEGFHPLRKSIRNGPIKVQENQKRQYNFKPVSGEGVYQIPVGPVHAGIIEPGHFRFSVIGETISNLEVRMFYKHRGIEKLAEGKTIEQGADIAEAISGDESAANAAAFAICAEKIGGVKVPTRAWMLRTVLLEMERIYSHLGDMAGMIVDVAFPKGATPFFVLREEILRWNNSLTGSRFIKGIIRPGGLARDIPDEKLERLFSYLGEFLPYFEAACRRVRSTSSVIDRLESTGIIRQDLVTPLNITGPAARACGVASDTRIDHPYGLYSSLCLEARVCETGDVLARFEVKYGEIGDSAAMIRLLLKSLQPGPISERLPVAEGHALAVVEAPRGQSFHWLSVNNGLIDRYKVRTASFCNWQAIEHAVMGNIVPDFPLINKSLNLSYAGTDL